VTSGANLLTARAIPASAAGSSHEPPPIGAATVSAFVRGFAALGFDVDALLASARVDPDVLRDPDSSIACSQFGAVIGAAYAERRMPNLALHLAAVIPIGAFPLLDYLILTCSTVGEGLQQLVRYMRLEQNPAQVGLRLDESPTRVTVDAPGNTFSVEFTTALAVCHLREETEGRFSPLAVHFAHRPDDVEEFGRILKAPVTAGSAWNGLLISEDRLKLPLRRRDATLRGVLEAAAARLKPPPEATDVVSEVRRVLTSRLTGGDMRVQSIARAMGTTTRTLQRRLAEAGVTYNEVLEATRRDAAEQYLAGRVLSIGEIGYLLGYSEPAAFHRAFKRWHGVTPAAFRMQNEK